MEGGGGRESNSVSHTAIEKQFRMKLRNTFHVIVVEKSKVMVKDKLASAYPDGLCFISQFPVPVLLSDSFLLFLLFIL